MAEVRIACPRFVAATLASLALTTPLSAAPQGAPPAPKPTAPAAPAAAPPAAQIERPLDPNAIDRYEPKLYDVKYEVVISSFPSSDRNAAINLADTPFVLPLIMRGPFSKIDPTSLQPQLYLDNKLDTSLTSRARLDENQELGMTFAVIPLPSFAGTTLRWNVSWRAQVWSCRINEDVLATKTWPREWPPEVREALKPQKGIESDQEFAKAIVESAVGSKLRAMSPWHAAKEIIRAVAIGFKSVNNDGWERRAQGRIIGLKMEGARESVRLARGSNHDLVAACVAALRAAEIPARPVVGFVEESRRDAGGKRRKQTLLDSWAEVFVPDAGWVPFDPEEIRGSAVRQLKVGAPWPGLGNMKDLNERVPIAWCFAPQGYSGSDFASLWGWRPLGVVNSWTLEAALQLQVTSRGKGIDDPN
jgi:hypothetical protein